MSDQVTITKRKSWGSRIMSSIKGVIFGLLFFLASFIVLYNNEGRVELFKVAETAIEIEADSEASMQFNEKLVSVTGPLESDESIKDDYLREGDYIAVERKVEMYSWVEREETSSKTNVGGSETETTNYTYEKKWVDDPENTSNFKNQVGHFNPKKSVDNKIKKVKKAEIGVYEINIPKVVLPKFTSLDLNYENVLEEDDFQLSGDKYLFKGGGSLNSPEIGDIRISYNVLYPIEKATVFGKLDLEDKEINSFISLKNSSLYRVFDGSREAAISKMTVEHKTTAWILRMVGFFLMWFGLMMLFGPVSVILDFLPIFGSISRGGVALITFIVAFILSVVTVLISIIIHNILALIVAIVLAIVVIIIYLKLKINKKKGPALGQSVQSQNKKAVHNSLDSKSKENELSNNNFEEDK